MTVKSLSACFYHDEKLGVTHCNVCMKPLCEDCVKRIEGGSYCSEDCAFKAKRALSNMNEIKEINAMQEEAMKRKNLQMAIVNFFVAIGLIVLFIFAWRNWIPASSKQQCVDLANTYAPFLNGLFDFLNGK